MKATKILATFIGLLSCTLQGFTQQLIPVTHFEKITVSPHIKLFLKEGEEETVTIDEHDVAADKINIKVEGKNLLIYLDDAKTTTKQIKRTENGRTMSVPIYQGTQVTAHVTYKTLKDLSIRGEETITFLKPLVEDRFTVNLYGESKLIIDSLETKEFKAILYGENNLIIHKGQTTSQIFKAYGESKIDAEQLLNTTSKVTSYGGSTFNINAAEEIKVWAFGDVNINYTGNAHVHKLITIGDVKLKKIE